MVIGPAALGVARRRPGGRPPRATMLVVGAMAGLMLAGCSASDEFPQACDDVRTQERALRVQATATAGATQQDQVDAERRWAELIVGEPECFTPERVVIARTVLQPPF